MGTNTTNVPVIIGIAGSVAVGKSTVAQVLQTLLARGPLGTGLSAQQGINDITGYRLRQDREIPLLKHGAGSIVYDAMSGARQCRTQGYARHPSCGELSSCVLRKGPRRQSVHR